MRTAHSGCQPVCSVLAAKWSGTTRLPNSLHAFTPPPPYLSPTTARPALQLFLRLRPPPPPRSRLPRDLPHLSPCPCRAFSLSASVFTSCPSPPSRRACLTSRRDAQSGARPEKQCSPRARPREAAPEPVLDADGAQWLPACVLRVGSQVVWHHTTPKTPCAPSPRLLPAAALRRLRLLSPLLIAPSDARSNRFPRLASSRSRLLAISRASPLAAPLFTSARSQRSPMYCPDTTSKSKKVHSVHTIVPTKKTSFPKLSVACNLRWWLQRHTFS